MTDTSPLKVIALILVKFSSNAGIEELVNFHLVSWWSINQYDSENQCFTRLIGWQMSLPAARVAGPCPRSRISSARQRRVRRGWCRTCSRRAALRRCRCCWCCGRASSRASSCRRRPARSYSTSRSEVLYNLTKLYFFNDELMNRARHYSAMSCSAMPH